MSRSLCARISNQRRTGYLSFMSLIITRRSMMAVVIGSDNGAWGLQEDFECGETRKKKLIKSNFKLFHFTPIFTLTHSLQCPIDSDLFETGNFANDRLGHLIVLKYFIHFVFSLESDVFALRLSLHFYSQSRNNYTCVCVYVYKFTPLVKMFEKLS